MMVVRSDWPHGSSWLHRMRSARFRLLSALRWYFLLSLSCLRERCWGITPKMTRPSGLLLGTRLPTLVKSNDSLAPPTARIEVNAIVRRNNMLAQIVGYNTIVSSALDMKVGIRWIRVWKIIIVDEELLIPLHYYLHRLSVLLPVAVLVLGLMLRRLFCCWLSELKSHISTIWYHTIISLVRGEWIMQPTIRKY